MTKQQKEDEEKVIEEFMKSRERMKKFLTEELESRKSALREKIRKAEMLAAK